LTDKFYWADTDVFNFSLPITDANMFALLQPQLKDIFFLSM